MVFSGKFVDLLRQMIWSHQVAHLRLFVMLDRLVVWRSPKYLLESLFEFLQW